MASYEAELKINNQSFKAMGESVFEALKAVHPHPNDLLFFKTKGHIHVSLGKNKVERNNLTPLQLRRLFNKIGNYSMMKIIAEQISAGFK